MCVNVDYFCSRSKNSIDYAVCFIWDFWIAYKQVRVCFSTHCKQHNQLNSYFLSKNNLHSHTSPPQQYNWQQDVHTSQLHNLYRLSTYFNYHILQFYQHYIQYAATTKRSIQRFTTIHSKPHHSVLPNTHIMHAICCIHHICKVQGLQPILQLHYFLLSHCLDQPDGG